MAKRKNKSKNPYIIAVPLLLVILSLVTVGAVLILKLKAPEPNREREISASVSMTTVEEPVTVDGKRIDPEGDISPFYNDRYDEPEEPEESEEPAEEEEPSSEEQQPESQAQVIDEVLAREPGSESVSEPAPEAASEPESAPPAPPKNDNRVKTVACIGDSITYGDGVSDKSKDSYPALLQGILGSRYEVINYGHNGTTLLDSGDDPYRDNEEYGASLTKNADIYIIMLGTNDSKPDNWNSKDFPTALGSFVDTYLARESQPQVILMVPPRAFPIDGEDEPEYDIKDTIIARDISVAVQSVARSRSLKVIDLYALTSSHPEWYTDGIHPNATGNAQIASYISGYIS